MTWAARTLFNYATPLPPAATTGGLVMALDAKQYVSGQIWANQVVTPADGQASSAYSFIFGNSGSVEATDPTIVGAGTDAAYFSFDGGDYFTCAVGSGNTFFRNMHKGSQPFSIEVWMYWTQGGANAHPLFDSGTSDQGGTDMSRGVIFADLGQQAGRPGSIQFRLKRDTAAASALNVVSDLPNIPHLSVQMLGVSFTPNGSSFLYRNGNYAPVGGLDTFTATVSAPGALDAINPARIGVRGDASAVGIVLSGTRIYLMRIYNRALSKAEFDDNWGSTRGRFGI